ncbi:DUF2771 family protein [Jatrophihabitans sp. DSM 45814]
MTSSIDRSIPAVASRRSGRPIAMVIALIAAAMLLSACGQKPRPTVTVFSGSTAKKVSAQQPCALLKTCSDDSKIVELTVRPGSTILVDVSHDLADAGWIATAFTEDSTGKSTTVDGAGTAAPTRDFTARLNVPQAQGGYFVRITAVRPSNQLTTWLVQVKLEQ